VQEKRVSILKIDMQNSWINLQYDLKLHHQALEASEDPNLLNKNYGGGPLQETQSTEQQYEVLQTWEIYSALSFIEPVFDPFESGTTTCLLISVILKGIEGQKGHKIVVLAVNASASPPPTRYQECKVILYPW